MTYKFNFSQNKTFNIEDLILFQKVCVRVSYFAIVLFLKNLSSWQLFALVNLSLKSSASLPASDLLSFRDIATIGLDFEC